MAWSSAVLSSTIRSLLANDKPLAVGSNLVRNLTSSTIQWRTTGSWASGSDVTDTSFPTSGLYDGYTHIVSKPTATADPHYLTMDFGALVTFDSIAIINHNLSTIAGMVVSVEIADTNNFVTSLQNIANWTPGSRTKRLVNFNMDHTGGGQARAYTAQYVRIKFDPTSVAKPSVGEVILGSRRQLKHQPEIPWDPDHRNSAIEEARSYSGVVSRTVHYRGQRVMQGKLTPSESTYINDLIALYESDTSYGTLPFLWVDKPTTDPQSAFFMLMSTDFTIPYTGPNGRELQISAVEQGPHFVELEA